MPSKVKKSSTNAEISTLALKVQPGARQNRLSQEAEGWKVQITAPPVDGQANEAVCTFIAREVLGLPKRAVRLKSGSTSRNKIIEVDLSSAALDVALRNYLSRISPS